MSVTTNKQIEIVMDTDILKVSYNNSAATEIQCEVSLTGANGTTVCSADSLLKVYEGLRELFAEIKKD